MNTVQHTIFDETRHFTNRGEEVQRIEQYIINLRRGIIPSIPLLNYTGVPGIGKSALLERLHQVYKADPSIIVLTVALQHIRLDQRADLIAIQRWILRLLLLQCQRYAPDMTELRDLDQQVQNAGTDSAGLSERLSQLIELVLGYHLERPILMLIDGCEYVIKEALDWLESQMLRTLVVSGRSLCILNSQEPLRFREFELRRRVTRVMLDPLEPTATIEQVALPSQLSSAVYKLTNGHPLANEIAYKLLAQASPLVEELDDEQSGRILAEFVAAIRRRIAAPVDDDLWQMIRVVVLLREFDANTLHTLMPVADVRFESYNLDTIYQLVQQLVETRLVRWRDDNRARTFEPRLRNIFVEELRLNSPQFSRRIHAAAANYYDQLISEAPRGRNQFLIEHYYHDLYKADPPQYNTNTIRDKLTQHLLRHYYSPSRSFADNASLDTLEELLLVDDGLQQALHLHNLSPSLLLDIVQDVRRQFPGDRRHQETAATPPS